MWKKLYSCDTSGGGHGIRQSHRDRVQEIRPEKYRHHSRCCFHLSMQLAAHANPHCPGKCCGANPRPCVRTRNSKTTVHVHQRRSFTYKYLQQVAPIILEIMYVHQIQHIFEFILNCNFSHCMNIFSSRQHAIRHLMPLSAVSSLWSSGGINQVNVTVP